MKKTILTFVALAATSILSAQTGAGTIMLGGDFGINSSGTRTDRNPGPGGTIIEDKTDGYMNWHFSPTVGYFIADEFAVGVRLDFANNFRNRKTNGTSTEDIRISSIGASIFGRKYFSISDNFFLFGDASIGINRSSYTNRVDGTEPNQLVDGDKHISSDISFNIAPGLAFFPSEKWGIDFTLNKFVSYVSESSKRISPNNGGESTTKQGFFSLGAGFMPSLGIHYYLSR